VGSGKIFENSDAKSCIWLLVWTGLYILTLRARSKGLLTPDAARCVAVRHRAACCVVFVAYRKTPHRTLRTASGVNEPQHVHGSS